MSNKDLSLLPNDQSISIPKNLVDLEPARVSRYLITANLIKQATSDITYSKILDLGGKKGLLREFGIKSTIIDIEDSEDENYIKGSALDMPFKDNSFDVVVSCDVLEHILSKDREKFIQEAMRVTNGFVIICAPFNNSDVSESEKKANTFYKNISSENHRWLIEHIENGLPDMVKIEKFLKDQKYSYKFYRHLSLKIWDLTTKIHFLNAVFGDSKDINSLSKKIYLKYYNDLCGLDYSDTGYRTFLVLNKNGSFNLKLPNTNEREKAINEFENYLNKELIKTIEGLAVEKRELQNKTIEQHLINNKKYNENLNKINALKSEIQDIKSSQSYKLAQKLSKAKNFYK